jgi:stage III sporulation protein AG
MKKTLAHFKLSESKTKIIFVIGIAGIVLIALSSLNTGSKAAKESPPAAASDNDYCESEQFRQQMTEELENILSNIDGVGECRVMISVEGTSEYYYAENIDKTQEYSPSGSNEQYQNEVVVIDSGDNKQALVRKKVKPKINGVVVVCAGGGDITVKERVIKAVSAALNLSYGKICVEGKTKIER